MKNRKKILLLEDDANLGFILKEHLELHQFEVKHCPDGVAGLTEFRRQKYSLCLVDVMMPKKDGFLFVKEVRRIDTKTPVIFLTAKSLKEDRIEGLKIGADDYVTKPFSMEELLLRISAVLRRSGGGMTAENKETTFAIGKYRFDHRKSSLQLSGGKLQKLTSKESDVLRMLAVHQNDLVERCDILDAVWGDDSYYNARSMDVYVSKLRKYLMKDENVTIKNIHGKGYKLIAGK